MASNSPLRKLLDTLPQVGCVEWIGLRPAREETMQVVDEARLVHAAGLEGDRFHSRADGPRQVTLMQHEHLAVIAACLGRETVTAELLRRNIVVSGLNLLALKDKRFCLGSAVLEFSGACHPCSKMERALGAGGYNAMRGHGGITARVIESGRVRLGDAVEPN